MTTRAPCGHPWAGREFTVGWGLRVVLDVTVVRPDVVVEAMVDVVRLIR
ncbi:hypothetical protein [Streptomyces sp. NPDC004783]